MFRNRQNSQKPDDELINKFQRTFSDLVPPQSNPEPFGQPHVGQITPARLNMGGGDVRHNDQNGHNTPDSRFTPSFLDPGSLPFMPFPNQQNGFYPPNSSGMSSILHSQAGDLHTPNMGMHLISPLSQQMAGVDNTTMNFDQFNQSFFPPNFHNPQPFPQQDSFAPSAFVHDSYDAIDESVEESSMHDADMQGNSTSQGTMLSQELPLRANTQDEEGEKFRYHTTLRAPTAMVKHHKEIPVTYLNKGQAYSLSVADLAPPMGSHSVKYRTFVRVSFQEDEQRSKPATCWQLWKEGRGTNEAHQRGGKLQAVEYVDPIQGPNEDQKLRQIQLENASFDGFCVTWSPNLSTGKADCSIPVRFNFLSTDFSHSKGVKGIPVRLCAKTEVISLESPHTGTASDAEVCYCQVKLFRDHGAERKLSNDVAHVRKTIDKLRQQIFQAEMGGGNFGKRKRGNGSFPVKGSTDHRPAKITKHKRTWSMDSNETPERLSLEDDLHVKLAMMQDMFTSTRPVSILGLRGDEQDDPDLFPVELPGDSPEIKKEGRLFQNPWPPRASLDTTPAPVIQTLSPSASNASINSPLHPLHRNLSNPSYDSAYQGSLESSRGSSQLSEASGEKVLARRPMKVQRLSPENTKMSMGYIEAVDIDPTYRPPSERPPKPIACFYIRFPRNETQEDDYYRAVYLTERTAKGLLEQISLKRRIDPERVVRVLHIKQNGLKIMVDDDVVRELPDGQDMVAEISEFSIPDTAVNNGEAPGTPTVEVKLTY
ncbi:hypothetical protein ASPWEDRAFT_49287 [Aspergillus wentii DTO 134E9]|uniref:Grh/CP2 DB domain-containing protein n=1 Tax=Aspergillus wentii DTO 134E9 TaxID=1073089 RepID=A0A1L9RWJ4_ASPWE|nr:uncharacterized protein ASPWEDRAFT_49287 [Aspergillus wentii DTO 134E9]OJJ39253.1 hypothetical protein ASPWEDRAFT_49287 [Aspergillus wentii DTO 134E9]